MQLKETSAGVKLMMLANKLQPEFNSRNFLSRLRQEFQENPIQSYVTWRQSEYQ